MLENSRHLLALCVVCGVIGSYLISVYVLVLVFVVCVFIFVNDSKLLGQGASAIKDFTFPVPSWIKSIITSLMNSYHLSKPLEPEPSSRRSSPFSPNVPIPRRPGCRTGRFTCLDENTDYANRRNGIGLCSANPAFNNSYSNSLHGFRRHNSFSDADNSAKIDEFSTPQTSPWARRQNYSGNEFGNVRRVQTVAGPLLATSGLTKRKSNDFGLYVDANSPGLASRIVQYREEGISPGGTVWTHQPQYNSPGQFPMVHLSHSPSSLPVLSPLSSQKASRRSVRVKIAPPDPLGSRLYPLTNKNNASYTSTVQADHSTKSVLETLKEISRKRIHSQLEENDDDAAKRQKRNGHPDMLAVQTDDDNGDGENVSKRLREESPRQQELSPPTRPAKRIRNNEILSSLSSSRKLMQGGGIKRKTQNLDWSRCSTPVLGKQQKTVCEDALSSLVQSTSGARTSSLGNQSVLTQALQEERHGRSNQNDMKTPLGSERKGTHSLSSGKTAGPGKELSKSISHQVTPVTPKAVKKTLVAPVDDTPWQKDSPFVSVLSPDDIIDDVSALEEKREQDRRSRLMAMMTVISGGEPPVKMPVTTAETTASAEQSTFNLNSSTFAAPPIPASHVSKVSSEKPMFGSSTLASGWSTNVKSITDSSVAAVASVSTHNVDPVTSRALVVTSSEPAFSKNPVTTSPMFTFANSVLPVANTSQTLTNNTDLQGTSAVLANTNLPVAPVFGSSSTLVSTQQTTPVSSPPVFGSASALFGSKSPANTENVDSFNSQFQSGVNSATTTVSSGNLSFGFTSSPNSQVSFGVPTTSVTQSTATATSTAVGTPVTSSSVFQLHPAVSGLGQDNCVSSSSSGFSNSSAATVVAVTSGHSNIFTKTTSFGASEKTAEGTVTTVATGSSLFGTAANPSVATTSPTVSSFVFGNTATSTPASVSQIKPGMFSFGNSPVPTPSSQEVSNTSNAKSVFGSASGGFGQPVENLATNAAASSQPVNTQPAASKIGGFKFDLSPGKSPFISRSNVPSSSTTHVFGNPSTTTVSSETKSFTFGSTKTIENPFALNSSNNNPAATTSQAQTSVNLFGSAVQQKSLDVEKPKENLFSLSGGSASQVFSTAQTFSSQNVEKPKENMFSLGGNSTVSPVFSGPQTGGFSTQPSATNTTANGGFLFSSATPSGFSQSQTGAGGFSMQPAAASGASFGTPNTTTTAANTAFGFGNTVPNQTPQSNPFAFGTSTTTSDTQPGGLFAFGSSNSATASGGSGLFGQPAAPTATAAAAASIQPQIPAVQASATAPAAPAPAFQFGASGAPQQQLSGTFSFGSSSTGNPTPASGFPSGGSFQMNAGGFGSGPAMFSIGSGSTAPRARSARTRRTK